ncbi:thermonuclease family protein [Methyloligella sp. 2.7D]|uniref:thermonuclease family protein n=1 Tax=unclassified Methyloligella TaxID=2625955 RepID=UPI00157DE788|nr:thermonuclease family protein [Methyloligella sp. GL2]QKP78488.1 thermonuclease family protein [Methyloligella sp. GL2]
MYTLARIVALAFGVAVLMLFVLPHILGLAPDRDDGPQLAIETPPAGNSDTPDKQAIQSWGTSLPKDAPGGSVAKRVDAPQPPKPQPALADAPEEVRRFAAIEKGHAIKAGALPRRRYYRVVVTDGATLQAGSKTIRLKGIEAKSIDAECEASNGAAWPCGSKARGALMRLIRGRAVICTTPPSGERESFSARCTVSGTDLSEWMLRQGWATCTTPAPEALAEAERAAKQEKLGLWQNGN